MSMEEVDVSGTLGNEAIILESKTASMDAVLVEGDTDKVLERGPLEYVMPCSRSKILDFLLTFRDFDYSISDIAKNSGLSFKTGLNEVRKLEEKKFIVNSRNVGKAIMFKLNMDSPQVKLLSNLAMEIATERIKTPESKSQLAQAYDKVTQAKLGLQQKKIRARG